MSKGQEELDPLPSEKLCNKFKPYNHPKKIAGDGPLGNEKKGKMHYIGNDKKEVVITLQKMLKTLEYDLGTSGTNNDGVDGKFWDSTEEAVIDFQGKNKDWDGEQLKEEGKVGPRSSDALNRAVVGKEYVTKVGEQYVKQNWYDYYQTPVKLTSECVLLTATAKALKNKVPIEIEDEKKGKVVITDFQEQTSVYWITEIPDSPNENISLLIRDDTGKEICRIHSDKAKPGPEKYFTFDLSFLDGNIPYLFELYNADKILAPILRLSINALRESLDENNTTAAGASFFVAEQLAPPSAPLDEIQPVETLEDEWCPPIELKESSSHE